MSNSIKEKVSTVAKDFLAMCLKPIIASSISFGVAFTPIPILWRVLMCFVPWILLFVLERTVFEPERKKEIKKLAEHKRKVTPLLFMRVRKLVDGYLSKEEEKRKKKDYFSNLESICNIVRDYYVQKGGDSYDKYSISLKEIDSMENIREVCRDTSPLSQGRKHEFIKSPYPLEENTPYKEIIDAYKKGDVKPYIENDVHKKIIEGKYDCTRLHKAGGIKGVPYKSIFVSPILPLVNPSKEKIRGFICVDAEDPDMFRTEDDESLDIVFHEYVSGVIYKMIEIQEQIKD
jgi:hypothetical protein